MDELIKSFKDLMESHGVLLKIEIMGICAVNVNRQIETHQKHYEALATAFAPETKVRKVKK